MPESRNSNNVNYYSTNYSKFQKNAPGADMLNKEYELKRRQSLEKSSSYYGKNLLNYQHILVNPATFYQQQTMKNNIYDSKHSQQIETVNFSDYEKTSLAMFGDKASK